jgi:sterol desaturase/sphingolipid hydroxylase (fatty acid hydroxylase superfamily)
VGGWAALAFVLIAALETWRQRSATGQGAERWVTNLGLFALEQAVNLAWVAVLDAVAVSVAGPSPLTGWTNGWPEWAALIFTVIALDATAYVTHVLSHHIEPLWRLHSVHHADRVLDVTTTVRHHPLEVVPTAMALSVCTWLFDLSLAYVAAYAALSFVTQALAHADLGLSARVMRGAGLVLVTPELHALHHSRIWTETNSNYGQMLSVWDRLFGTMAHPRAGPIAVGLDTYSSARFRGLPGALAQPFRQPDARPDVDSSSAAP